MLYSKLRPGATAGENLPLRHRAGVLGEEPPLPQILAYQGFLDKSEHMCWHNSNLH
jgi:hypothetical protein